MKGAQILFKLSKRMGSSVHSRQHYHQCKSQHFQKEALTPLKVSQLA